jgi:tetratricopeptide (TPR) repeat protein
MGRTKELLTWAKGCYAAGDFAGCRELALRGLTDNAEDVELLRLLGKSSVELGVPGAAELLRTVARARSADAQSWRDLGAALLLEGRFADAVEALEEAVRLSPGDADTLVDLAHAAHGARRVDEAVSHLRRAAELDADDVRALRSLVRIQRRSGRLDDALAAARELLERAPGDVVAFMDIADLCVLLGRLDDAVAAFEGLRTLEDDPEHQVYALHGLFLVAARRGDWRRALEHAVEATRLDRLGRTTDLLAYAVAQTFGAADRPAPSRAQVDAALAASQAEHRRLHAEADAR